MGEANSVDDFLEMIAAHGEQKKSTMASTRAVYFHQYPNGAEEDFLVSDLYKHVVDTFSKDERALNEQLEKCRNKVSVVKRVTKQGTRAKPPKKSKTNRGRSGRKTVPARINNTLKRGSLVQSRYGKGKILSVPKRGVPTYKIELPYGYLFLPKEAKMDYLHMSTSSQSSKEVIETNLLEKPVLEKEVNKLASHESAKLLLSTAVDHENDPTHKPDVLLDRKRDVEGKLILVREPANICFNLRLMYFTMFCCLKGGHQAHSKKKQKTDDDKSPPDVEDVNDKTPAAKEAKGRLGSTTEQSKVQGPRAQKTKRKMVFRGSPDESPKKKTLETGKAWPQGWVQEIWERPGGSSKDSYYFSPGKKKFDSLVKVNKFLRALERLGGSEAEAWKVYNKKEEL